MAKQISFNVDHAESLLVALHRLHESIRYDWISVVNQWENLRTVWQDEHFYKFERLFMEMGSIYKAVEEECDHHVDFLNQQILIATQLQAALSSLTDSILQVTTHSSSESAAFSVFSKVNFSNNPYVPLDQIHIGEVSQTVDQLLSGLESLLDKAIKFSPKAGAALLLFPAMLTHIISVATETAPNLMSLIDTTSVATGMEDFSGVKEIHEVEEQIEEDLGKDFGDLADVIDENQKREQEDRKRQSENAPRSSTPPAGAS